MEPEAPKPTRFTKRMKLTLAAVALVAVGGTAGAIAVGATRPSVEMAPLTPVAIRTLASTGNIVTLKGQVAEVYGNKFVMADASGRALVDTGRAGEDTALIATGQHVTVQGRFDRGFVRASFLIGADGKVVSLRPAGPPHGPHGDRGPRGDGPRGDHGPRDEAPPPPPADTTPVVPAPTAVKP